MAANGGKAGGLIGNNTGSTVTASYFAGTVSASGGGDAGGVSGEDDGADETYNHVYFDVDSTGISYGAGQTTTVALQTPTAATGTLYANWDNLDVDGDGTADEAPWDFGSAWNYPALNYGGLDPADQRNDYDADGDGLIEIDSLAKLNAMRWDVDGDGAPAPGATSTTAYYGAGAFFNAVSTAGGTGLVCPTTPDDADDNDCAGYELTADIDFDTNGDDDVDANDAIPNWTPIPGWATTLDGGGHVIENLTVSGAGDDRGLFSTATTAATVRSLGLVDVSVTGTGVRLGALAGVFNGRIAAVYATGEVTGAGGVGGLVAEVQSSSARIVASYARVDVECTSNQNWARVGGLAARNDGVISASYAAGEISGNCPAAARGGLVNNSPGTEPASYWDTNLTTIADDTDSPPQPPEGLSTLAMQTPTAYGANSDAAAIYRCLGRPGRGRQRHGRGGGGRRLGLRTGQRSPDIEVRRPGGVAPAGRAAAGAELRQPHGVEQGLPEGFCRSSRSRFRWRPSGNGALTLRGQRACRRASSSTPTARRSCPGNAPRMVCGTPTATTTAPVTVTITVSDSDDGNEDSTDEDDLTFTVEVVGALGGDLLPGGAWRRRP